MSFLKSLFNKKEVVTTATADLRYQEFWAWFQKHEKEFFKVVKKGDAIEKNFFDILGPKLNELKESTFWYLAGMSDDNTAELILTADGNLRNIPFIEDLVAAAPVIENWKITALKQPSASSTFGIKMNGYTFSEETMSFYANENPEMPDQIEITILHQEYTSENESEISHGAYLLLDNYLGELNCVTTIDHINFKNTKNAEKEIIPLEKLKDFLIWREKEFIEKYEGIRHHTEKDNYSSFNGTLKNGLPIIAIVNTDILQWNAKASHPWIAIATFKFDGDSNNGMPDDKTYELLNTLEDTIMLELKDSDGYVNIGRETADSTREIYFSCLDFRKPAKVFDKMQRENKEIISFDFEVYKDKYWQTYNKYL
ncbi:DUF695 domain-containing protein [Cellulophaga sp. Z1A5H]|uniref:DUF695 domain-containing protein n=1 Tax=Cellulophaga sp. Z1A5H TaxID=2687291 RepID=UPI0013FD8F55|nr:DUF695 domain-containing protein [Cellulophaga sp. Z1A5H]